MILKVDVESIDFGSFPQLEKQERKFTLTNTGQHVLVIYDVITSCGCTRVNYSKEGIRPGEKAVLTVIYEAEKAEHFSKTARPDVATHFRQCLRHQDVVLAEQLYLLVCL